GVPTITKQPAGTNINLTQTAAFCVTATGAGTLTYQWRVNGVNILGATNSCIFVSNVQAKDAGAYDCLVANGVAVVTSDQAVLVVLDFPPGPFPADDFDNRVELFGATGDLEVDNRGATKQPGEPNPAGKPGGSSVWYKWTATDTGIATFRTTGS